MCTKHEPVSSLRRWHETNTPLLLKLQLPPRAEPIVFKKRIGHLVSDELFSETLPLTWGFSKLASEYDKSSKCIHGTTYKRTSIHELKLQQSTAPNRSLRDEPITRKLQ